MVIGTFLLLFLSGGGGGGGGGVDICTDRSNINIGHTQFDL